MARPRKATGPKVNATDLHRAWLQLVDTDGPFLAIPPLKRVWPNGIPDFRTTHSDRFEVLVEARKAFEASWEVLDRDPDSETRLVGYRTERDKWVETMLREVVGWGELLKWGIVPGVVEAHSPNRAVTVTAQGALLSVDGIGALVLVVDPTDSLHQTPSDLWAATPVDRCVTLLRENRVEIGIVTDGRWWGLVCAREGSMAASGIVDALTWIEEPRARDAFLTLLGRQHIIGGDPAERLPVLFEESIAAAEEITEALGAQVRRAVELLIQSFSESAAEAERRALPYPLPEHSHDIYEAAVTVMMRAVFLLFAEERGLLPSGELFEQGYGVARELDRLTARENDESEEALDATSLVWHRLLATSQALYKGASFENLRMPAYGGSLFDPERFPFLTDTTEQGALAITVSDRVMLHVLRSVQIAHVKGERRQISFRDIDVEQIGYIYEGLLGYTAVRVGEPTLGIIGSTGAEPEIPLATLESLAATYPDPKKLAGAVREWLAEDQPSASPSSAAAIAKVITTEVNPSAISALTQVTRNDNTLHERIKPWLGLIRPDLRGHPFVVLTGGLVVKETPSRKNAGAHYTPKSLAEEVVTHALQPLCYSPGPHQTPDSGQWRLISSDELLGLKVADIACGSGAFLVAAARYIADRVVEAWTDEDPTNARRKDLRLRAIRQVVANCLYGADINDMAVEMCKLSLWLVSLDRDLPFSFVDDKVFLGNSLLGLTSLDQLRKLHIDPSRTTEIEHYYQYDVDIDAITSKAVALRERLATEIDEDDPARSSAAKHRQLRGLREVTRSLRAVADGVVSAGLPLGGKPGKALDDAYGNLREAVKKAHPGPGEGEPDSKWLHAIIARGLTPTVKTDYERWQPLHWLIEVPDVVAERNGFDAVIGNPPFLGSNKTPGAIGENMHDWYAHVIGDGVKAKADMVAFFLLRAYSLLRAGGSMGLIATHAVAQGDTREVGLDTMADRGMELTRAIQSRPWPARAGASFAALWGTNVEVSELVPRICDGVSSFRISTLLEPTGRVEGRPKRLPENAGKAFNGCYLLGMGFVVTLDVVSAWIAADPRNAEVLFPYLTGDDLNGRPGSDATQWVIDFNDLSYDAASSYVIPMEHVRKHVKPDRDGNPRKAVAERWWQYAEKRPGMRRALHDLDHCIAIRQTSNTQIPTIVSTGQVIDQTVVVFGSDSFHLLGVLTSSVHQLWASTHGLRTMAGILRYTPSDVFDPFPFPKYRADVEVATQQLFDERKRIMHDRGIGLTKLYNSVNDPAVMDDFDPDICRLRKLHVALDKQVMRAYGWDGLDPEYGFVEYRKARKWTVSPAARVEILDLLLEENHRRAAAEAAARPKNTTKGRKAKAVSQQVEVLFP